MIYKFEEYNKRAVTGTKEVEDFRIEVRRERLNNKSYW